MTFLAKGKKRSRDDGAESHHKLIDKMFLSKNDHGI